MPPLVGVSSGVPRWLGQEEERAGSEGRGADDVQPELRLDGEVHPGIDVECLDLLMDGGLFVALGQRCRVFVDQPRVIPIREGGAEQRERPRMNTYSGLTTW